MKYSFVLVLLASLPAAAGEPIAVRSVFLTLLEEVEVPSREAGVLTRVDTREGRSVKKGDPIGQVDDRRAQMVLDLAKIELKKSRRDAANMLQMELAKKNVELTKAEYQRARNSHERLPRSVSQTELDRLLLENGRAELELKQAQFDFATAQLVVSSRESEVAAAQHDVQRRQVLAPLDGFVVEVMREAGEWVEPGETVLQLVRMDCLRAEGLLDVKKTQVRNLLGRQVRVSAVPSDETTAEFNGVVTFVSPEVEPVSSQVRVWAEVDNRRMRHRPGMQVEMQIH